MTSAVFSQTIDIVFSDNVPKQIQENSRLLVNQRIFLLDKPLTEFRVQQLSISIASLIEQAAQPYGYFQSKGQVKPMSTSQKLVYSAHCTMNAPVKVRSFNIHISGPGKSVVEPLLLTPKDSPKIDAIFSSDSYEASKSQLLNLCHREGYINASTKNSKININPDSKNADILIDVETGPLYLFGPIEINQNIYNKDYLRSLADYHSGEPYNDAMISKYRDNLESTNLFNYVNVIPFSSDKKKQNIPTQIFYDPIDKTQYGVGVGYSTDSNFFYSANVVRNRINQYGMRLNTELLSSSDYSYAISTLSIPKRHPTKDYYNFQVGYKQEYIEYVGTDKNITTSFSHIFNHQINEKKIVRRETSLNYSLDHSKFDNTNTTTIHFLYPSIWYDIYLKHPENNVSLYLKHQLSANLEAFLAPCDFAKITTQQKINYSPFARTTLQLALKEGYIATSDSQETLPLSWYFYTGGSYSVRGFSYQSIGADIHKTFDYNHYLYTASFEVQQRLYQDFYLIAFVDSGDATDNIAHSKASVSVGSGILWKTFAGNLELSIAKPIKNYSIDPSMRPRLNIILSHPL
ncbi:MAG: BamA/TamA family outer membrane protein [Pseudomonadota bacterium]|nr:BamA/TamA family outer membrane protein [Pseudomonadota bacterium]